MFVDWYCNCDMAFSLCAPQFSNRSADKMEFSFSLLLLLLFAITLCEWCDLICDMDRWQAGRRKSKSLARSLSSHSAQGYTIVCDLYAWHAFTAVTECTHFPLHWWATVWPPSQHTFQTFWSAFDSISNRELIHAWIKRTDEFINSFVESAAADHRRHAAMAIINGTFNQFKSRWEFPPDMNDNYCVGPPPMCPQCP